MSIDTRVLEFFEQAKSRGKASEIVYVSVIDASGLHQRFDMLWDIYREMEEKGNIRPGLNTYLALVQSFLRSPTNGMQDAIAVLDIMNKKGIQWNYKICNLLLSSIEGQQQQQLPLPTTQSAYHRVREQFNSKAITQDPLSANDAQLFRQLLQDIKSTQ